MKEKDLVVVEWVDSQLHTGWSHLSDFKPDISAMEIRTVGYIVHNAPLFVGIAQSFTSRRQDAAVNPVMQIPKCSITSVKQLKVGKKRALHGRAK